MPSRESGYEVSSFFFFFLLFWGIGRQHQRHGHHHGSLRKPSPMPSTLTRTVGDEQVGDAVRRRVDKPLRGNAVTLPARPSSRARDEQKGASPRC